MRLSVLLDITTYLLKNNIKTFLCEGTLLGAIRNNDFIDWDPDIDLGILYENKNQVQNIINLIRQKYNIKQTYGFLDDGYEITINTTPRIDVFFFYKQCEKLYNSCYSFRYPDFFKINYFYDIFELKTINFLSHEFLAPVDAIKYLSTRYGASWNIPINKEYTLYDPKNLVIEKQYTYKEIVNNYE